MRRNHLCDKYRRVIKEKRAQPECFLILNWGYLESIAIVIDGQAEIGLDDRIIVELVPPKVQLFVVTSLSHLLFNLVGSSSLIVADYVWPILSVMHSYGKVAVF